MRHACPNGDRLDHTLKSADAGVATASCHGRELLDCSCQLVEGTSRRFKEDLVGHAWHLDGLGKIACVMRNMIYLTGWPEAMACSQRASCLFSNSAS